MGETRDNINEYSRRRWPQMWHPAALWQMRFLGSSVASQTRGSARVPEAMLEQVGFDELKEALLVVTEVACRIGSRRHAAA